MPAIRGKTIEVLFSASAIARRNLDLARAIGEDGRKDLIAISILKGSFVFAADLIRALHDVGLAPEVEFMMLSTYGEGTEAGQVKLLRDIDSDVGDRDVLLIDDILESGRTLTHARQLLMARGARSVSVAVLLDKRSRRQKETPFEAEYVGFECPDHFVVGYGMDVGHAFRELPFVGIVTGDAP